MTNAKPDQLVAELRARVWKQHIGEFYIVNTLVPPRDGARVIGPLTEEQVKEKKAQYGFMLDGLTPEVRAMAPFTAFKCIDEAVFEPYQV